MAANQKVPVTLKEYELIYRVLSAAGEHFGLKKGGSCLFYNIAGTIILKDFFGLDAHPQMGSAFIRLSDDTIIAYASKNEEGVIYSSEDAFHCWIKTGDYYVDFTAPEYGEDTKEYIRPKMFQKSVSSMEDDLSNLHKDGAFLFHYHEELSNHLILTNMELDDFLEFILLCKKWVQQCLTQESDLRFSGKRGKDKRLTLPEIEINDEW